MAIPLTSSVLTFIALIVFLMQCFSNIRQLAKSLRLKKPKSIQLVKPFEKPISFPSDQVLKNFQLPRRVRPTLPLANVFSLIFDKLGIFLLAFLPIRKSMYNLPARGYFDVC